MLLNDLRPDITTMTNYPKIFQEGISILHQLEANVDRIKLEANPLLENKRKYD